MSAQSCSMLLQLKQADCPMRRHATKETPSGAEGATWRESKGARQES